MTRYPLRDVREDLALFAGPGAFVAAYLLVILVWTRAVSISASHVIPVVILSGVAVTGSVAWSTAACLFPASGIGATTLRRLGCTIGFFGLGTACTALTAVLSFTCNRLDLPLRDAAFARADAAIGFHWRWWIAFVDRHSLLHRALAVAYGSHIVEYMAAFLLVGALLERRRVVELFWMLNLGGILTCLVSGLFPALGAAPYYGHAASWLADLLAIRRATPVDLDMFRLTGIVSLPSYHTELAIFFAWAVRRTSVFGWAVAALNVAMIASTPSEGGHYLVDTLAGVALAAAVVAIVHRQVYRPADAAVPGTAIIRYPFTAAPL